MQDIIDNFLNLMPYNEYILYAIVAFFVLLAIVCALIIFIPRQKMPKPAQGNIEKSKKVKTKKEKPQKHKKLVELNAALAQNLTQEQKQQNSAFAQQEKFAQNFEETKLGYTHGAKVINLADAGKFYKPLEAQNNIDEPKPMPEKLENDNSQILTQNYVQQEEQIVEEVTNIETITQTVVAETIVKQTIIEEKVVTEEIVENDVEENDSEEVKNITENGKQYEIIYRKSFQAKLIQSTDEIKEYYAQVADYLVNFGVKNKFAWSYSLFNQDKKTLAKIAIRGKTLCLYLALLPKMFLDSKYHVKDVSDTKKFESTPLMVKIKSDRGVKFAKELIDEMMKSFGLSANISFVPTITANLYKFDTTDSLLEQGLIKLVKREVKQ